MTSTAPGSGARVARLATLTRVTDAATSTFTMIDGVAEPSRIPSSVPVVIVPDDVLKDTAGPVPVVVGCEGRQAGAWAWAQRAWNGTPGAAKAPSVPADGVTFSLSRLAWENLEIVDRPGPP